jgi:hypothetical protein
MTKRILAVTFAIAAAGTVAAGTASAAPAFTTSHDRVVVNHHEPRHDPHCTRDGRWHNDNRDRGGHPDGRCPRW